MKKLGKLLAIFLVFGIGTTMLDEIEGAGELAILVAVVLIAWVIFADRPARKRKASAGAARPAKRRTSVRRGFVDSASSSVSRGITNILIPKGPTPDEQARARNRAEAEKQYWYYQKRADAYRGTPEGDKAQRQAWYYQSKMK